MSSWRDNPDLVRGDDDADTMQQIKVDSRWDRLFTAVEGIWVAPEGGGIKDGMMRATLKGFMWQAKKKVSIDPDGARDFTIQALQVVVASLEVEPAELFPDLKPKAPAVA